MKMAEITAVPMHMGDKNHPGPTFVQFKLTGYAGNASTGIFLTAELESEKAIDEAVKSLMQEVEKAGNLAKKLLSKGGVR
jgi:hypothetical protein